MFDLRHCNIKAEFVSLKRKTATDNQLIYALQYIDLLVSIRSKQNMA